ncbi:MAG: hypothetical protein NVS2B14_06060 [Chamaesiphon sp.]
MVLTSRQQQLLYEIYEVPYQIDIVITIGDGATLPSHIFGVIEGVKQRLDAAIAFINLEDSKVTRVGEILTEFETLRYSFKPNRNLRRLRQTLFPYTGIIFSEQTSNKLMLG